MHFVRQKKGQKLQKIPGASVHALMSSSDQLYGVFQIQDLQYVSFPCTHESASNVQLTA